MRIAPPCLLLLTVLALGCATGGGAHHDAPAKNVILFIGDGMGPPTIAAAAYHVHGMEGPGEGLFFEGFPVMGYTTTHTSDSLVADSAATATAMATGVRTFNGAIGVDDDRRSVETILEAANRRGMATGLVSSVPINHATPAAFAAHEESRNNYREILEDFAAEGSAQVLLGGAARDVPVEQAVEIADRGGYRTLTMESVDELNAIAPGDRVFGIFDADDDGHLAYQTTRRDEGSDEPELIDLTLAALNAIRTDPDGFFLMVEGGAIDWANHDNDAENAILETLEFERAIEVVVAALETSGQIDDTLIIVTADHECGGFNIVGPYRETLEAGEMPEIEYVHGNHTALPVHTFAMGPGAEALRGRHDNTDIHRAMVSALGL